MAERTYDILVPGPDGEPVRETVAEQVDDAVVAAEENGRTLRDRAVQALTANAAFLANASPSNAQVVQQVRLLTRECNALIRLVLGVLDSTDGT